MVRFSLKSLADTFGDTQFMNGFGEGILALGAAGFKRLRIHVDALCEAEHVPEADIAQ